MIPPPHCRICYSQVSVVRGWDQPNRFRSIKRSCVTIPSFPPLVVVVVVVVWSHHPRPQQHPIIQRMMIHHSYQYDLGGSYIPKFQPLDTPRRIQTDRVVIPANAYGVASINTRRHHHCRPVHNNLIFPSLPDDDLYHYR